MSRALEAVAFVAIATLLSPASRGQEKTFEIRGSVVAGSQPLARVDVSLRAGGTGEERKAVTDESGSFSFAGVPPGLYDLQAGSDPVTVPSPPFFLLVHLNVNRDLALVLPIEGGFCTQLPRVIHYFRRLVLGGDESLFAISGTVKGEGGPSVVGADVSLYIPKLGRVAATRTKRGGSFSFPRLKPDENYWIRVVAKGYFPNEITRLKVLAGYESIYEDVALESCEPGGCDPSLRQIRIIPGCE